ncbi:MAG: hypothetical protein GTO63_09800, partial [Anaerolineae bacterium]|nr:hypothetical protein [Anaerolineae bacterium]NIN95208.1 hypothetical protein [Anaerolineae bacterium]NIQ78185.1 hypothetical protein [Anaerolineae bacterium]
IVRKEFIDLAKSKGVEAGLTYSATPSYHATRVLGVDWDKYEATPNICCVEIDPADAVTCQVIYREEIPEGQFTLNYA